MGIELKNVRKGFYLSLNILQLYYMFNSFLYSRININ